MQNFNSDYYLTWSIDRNPVYINDNNEDNNEEIYNEINYNTFINIPDNTITNNNLFENSIETNDFIPFEPVFDSLNINFTLQTIITGTSEDNFKCCICMETKENHQICQLNCLHKYCSKCIIDYVSINRNNTLCPLCRVNIKKITVQNEEHLKTFKNL